MAGTGLKPLLVQLKSSIGGDTVMSILMALMMKVDCERSQCNKKKTISTEIAYRHGIDSMYVERCFP
jgi:hypothetical protein